MKATALSKFTRFSQTKQTIQKQRQSNFKFTQFQYQPPQKLFFHHTPVQNLSEEIRQGLLQIYKIPVDARVPNYKYVSMNSFTTPFKGVISKQ